MSYIEIKNMSKSYDNKKILRNICLSVDKGEMVAITGKSGSGKSTLLHLMAGLERMDEGTYQLDNKNIECYNQRQFAKLRNTEIGYILQSYGLISHFTAYENILIPFQLRHFAKRATSEELSKIARKLEITHLLNKKVSYLSGGEQQRVAIARALIICPKVILADEPTGALDDDSAEKLMDIFERLNAEGKTIILVTHDEKIANRTQRILRIEDGRFI